LSDYTIDAIDGSGRGLRVQFFRSLDRLAHTISCLAGEHVTPLLRSREGTDRQQFPPSPPMQQIAIQEVQQRQVALLVGMAGRSHWSVSLESNGAERRLYFDVACRANPIEGMSLASTYEVLQPVSIEGHAGEVHVHHRDCDVFLRTIAVGSDTRPPIHLQQNQLEIRPVDQQSGPTTRWAYELVLGSIG
jgi:hypothetical protein